MPKPQYWRGLQAEMPLRASPVLVFSNARQLVHHLTASGMW
jgi:hypothetical protein